MPAQSYLVTLHTLAYDAFSSNKLDACDLSGSPSLACMGAGGPAGLRCILCRFDYDWSSPMGLLRSVPEKLLAQIRAAQIGPEWPKDRG